MRRKGKQERESERVFDTLRTSNAGVAGAGGMQQGKEEDERGSWEARGKRVCILEEFHELITPTIINVA